MSDEQMPDKPMLDKRVVGFFVAGLLTAAAAYAIYAHVWDRSGDDDPIVVAGGSLEIGSRYGFDPDPGSHNNANHSYKSSVLNHITVLYNAAGVPAYDDFSVTGQVQVDIAYKCKGTCAGTPDDTVTFHTDANGKNLTISSKYPIGPTNPGTKQLTHPKADWTVNQITVTGHPSYPCYSGKCQVVLRYVCGSIVPGACKN
jgi:hypothetical protein